MKKKKLLALLLTLAMLVSLLPMAVLPAAAAGTTEVSSWDQLAAALAQGGDITLATDIEAPAGSKPLGVLAGVSATLDLNGKIINAKGQLADKPAITVNGSLTLEDTKDLGWITGASVGVYVIGNDAGTGTFTMNGGDIYNNNVGVAVYGGRFIMNGGYIDGNEREQYNKSLIGVYAVGSDTVFTMNDGDIYCNTAIGVYVSGGDFTMNGGLIDYNGIGIFAPDADFTVSDGYIYDNAIGVFAGGDFDMEGGTIFHNDYVGVIMGIGPEELGLDKTLSIDTALSETVNGDIMVKLFSENPARAGGDFYMSGDAAVEENGIMNVLVSGYAEGEGYNASLSMYDDAAVRATLSHPEIAAELEGDEEWTLYERFDLSVKPMLGVIAIDADVTMEDNAGIYGSFTEEEEEDEEEEEKSGKNKWYLPDAIDLGAFISNGTLSMSDSAKISGNSTIGVAGGYIIDAIAKLTQQKIVFERRGTKVVMSGNAAIENSGVLGVLLYGYDSEEGNLTSLTMSGASAIRGGESAFLEIPVGGDGGVPIKIPEAKPFDLHLHPQFGLAAVGADVTMTGYATISAPFAPFIQKDANDDYDITLQLGALMCNGTLKMSGASGITGNNIGGVVMGYPDDLVNLVLARFGKSVNGDELQDKKKLTPEDVIKAILLSKKTGNAINMAGSAAISGNGLFGAFTVGAGKEDYAKITMNGGSVVGNMVTGFAGVKTAYDLKNATIGKSLMGVLALLHSELDIGTGTAITDNTVGAAAIAASTITLDGGTVNNNTRAFTVNGTGDSIDQLMMLTGDLTTLPGVISEYVKNGIGVLRLVLSGQIDEEMAAPIAYAINGISGSDYMAEDDVTWAIDLLNYGLENSQQTGIVVETLTSALNVKSGEIKGNTHGVSAFTVNSVFLSIPGVGAFLAPYSETAGITLDGGFTLKGNTKSDVDLMSISVEVPKQNIAPEAPVISVGTLPEDSAIRTGVYQLLVKQVKKDKIEPAKGEEASTLEEILCAVAEVLHNARVTIDPLPDVPFTKGLESETEHFLSAIDGYVVALDAKTGTEAILHAGEVEMTLTDNQGDVEDGKQISMNSGSQHQINATVTGAPELFYSVGDESIVGVALAETGDGTWTITLTGKSAGTTEITIYTDGGQKASLTVSVSAPGGGGFGGGSKVYKITVAETENGTATASKTTAAEGEKITVTAKPADGYVLESITVKGEKAGNVEVKDGVFVMPADDVTVTVKFKKADAKQTFTDVKPGDWFYEGVEYVAAKGIMQGPGGGVFQPNETTTRAMVAQVIWNMAGKPVVNAAIPFADVAEGAWYADAVRWAAEKGIVTGWTEADGRQVFDPEGKVTREQFSAMLYRYAKTLGKGFTGMWSFKLDFPDAGDVSDWAMEAMSWMVMQGIINGMDGKLNPKGFSTRAQIATMLQRFDTLA